jgi:hypothetical protein
VGKEAKGKKAKENKSTKLTFGMKISKRYHEALYKPEWKLKNKGKQCISKGNH